MKHSDMKERNAQYIFNAVLDGNDTVKKIANITSLSHMAITDISNSFVNNGIFTLSTEKTSNPGRRCYHYAVSENFYSAYIEKRENFFCAILIDTKGRAIERRNFALHPKYTEEENMKHMFTEMNWYKNFKRCLNFFVVCDDEYSNYISSPLTLITKEELIIKNYADDDEIDFFNINGKTYLSVYGRLHIVKSTKSYVEKIFKLDKVFEIKGDLYDEIYISLQNATLKKMARIYHENEIKPFDTKKHYKRPHDAELLSIDMESLKKSRT